MPAPHDPGPELTDRPPLAPPDTSAWGPAQRRLGADEIALQWATWREQLSDEDFTPPGGRSATPEASGGEPDGAEPDTDQVAEAADPAEDTVNGAEGTVNRPRAGIRRVLAEARAYVETPPPLGRVRSSFAPGEARTLRADGPGWSMVARTDDIAFVLLDDEPGEVLPVGRGPELPGLLEALDKMAVRPS